MTARLRERIHRPFGGPQDSGADAGVSPVIGMILVLAVSIIGISSILYWGLPAIDEMKANVEFRSVETQFQELDATIRELVAGTTEKTAKRWQPSLVRGQIGVHNNTEPWLFAVEPYNAALDYDFIWGGLKDGNNTFSIYSVTGVTSVKVEASIITGTTSATALNVSRAYSGSTVQMTAADLPTWSAGTQQDFSVYTTMSAVQRLENATFRFRIYAGSTLVAEAWYAASGRVNYQLDAGLGTREVIETNGAVITRAGAEGYAIVNSPPIPPPTNTSGVHRIFARSIQLGGDTSAAGTDTFDLLLSLYATATLADYDCAKADRSDCVESVKLFNFGTMAAPWNAYLTNTNRGYDFVKSTHVMPGVESVTYLTDREAYMGFTLLQSALSFRSG